MESSDSRIPDMHWGSHTMAGVTIMGQNKDFYLEISNRLLRSSDDPVKSYIYIFLRHNGMISKV